MKPTIRRLARLDLFAGAALVSALVLITEFELLGAYSPTGQLEVAAVAFTGACVWLAVKNSVWTWPVGIIGTAFYLILFYEWRLYADAGLQVFYIVIGAVGLWAWLRRRRLAELSQTPEATRIGRGHLALVLTGVAVGTLLVRAYLIEVGGAAPFWDAFLTSGSIAAQYMLIRKYIENWYLWAVLDLAYVALFASREIYLTSALYLVFLAMVLRAAFEWRALLPAGVGESGFGVLGTQRAGR